MRAGIETLKKDGSYARLPCARRRLRVCDASLMLTIPRANTNTPPLMLAERIADLIRG
jgi:hypothetical protein